MDPQVQRQSNDFVSIVGFGYVGQSLAQRLFEVNGHVQIVDTREDLQQISRDFEARYNLQKDILRTASRFKRVEGYRNVVIITVPTGLDATGKPDLHPIRSVVEDLRKELRDGDLVILESTVDLGCTSREVDLPLNGSDKSHICIAFSPERIDPGNPNFHFGNIPKIVSGKQRCCLESTKEFYQEICDEVHVASSLEIAELAKLLENSFRLVNVSLVNSLAGLLEPTGISFLEAIDLAATKPFGFMKFYPGAGAGGHCIPVDPVYLQQGLVELTGRFDPVIQQAIDVNNRQPSLMFDLFTGDEQLARQGIIIAGVGYKWGSSDTRTSPGMEMLNACRKRGMEASYFDPWVAELSGWRNMSLEELLSAKTTIIATSITVRDFLLSQGVEASRLRFWG